MQCYSSLSREEATVEEEADAEEERNMDMKKTVGCKEEFAEVVCKKEKERLRSKRIERRMETRRRRRRRRLRGCKEEKNRIERRRRNMTTTTSIRVDVVNRALQTLHLRDGEGPTLSSCRAGTVRSRTIYLGPRSPCYVLKSPSLQVSPQKLWWKSYSLQTVDIPRTWDCS